MNGTARIGDGIVGLHTLPAIGHPHVTYGIILTGSGNVRSNGLGRVRTGDLGVHLDGVVAVLTGSGTVRTNGLPSSRVTDIVTVVPGPGTISTGSGNVFTG